MALHNDKNRVEEVFGKVDEVAGEAYRADESTFEDAVRKFGLGVMDGFIPFTEGSEQLDKFAEIIANYLNKKEIIVNKVKTQKAILKVDNSTRRELPYSFVIVTATNELTDKTYYHLIALESTLSDPSLLPPRASMLWGEIEQGRNPRTLPEFITPEVVAVIREMIAATLGVDENKLVGTNGIMVPFDAVPEEVAHLYGIVAFNNAASRLYHDTGLYSYIEVKPLTEILKQRGEFLKIDMVLNQGYAIDAVKRPIRSDVTLNLLMVKQRNSMSATGGALRYSSSDYYVDFGITIEDDVNRPGNRILKALPVITVDDNNSIKPGPDMMLLSIAKAFALGNPYEGYLPLLMNLPKDLGYLNVVVNAEGNPSGFGQPLKLKDGKKKPEEIMAAIKGLVARAAAYGIDTVFYGKDSGINSVYADLAIPSKAVSANDAIIALAEKMTGAKFQTRQFHFGVSILPYGYYIKDGKKIDLRELDLVEVAKTGRPELINRFVASLNPTNPGAFADRLFVINSLYPDAVIEGKIAKILISPQFLAEFEDKMRAAGFNAAPDFSHMQITTFRDISIIAQAFAGAEYMPKGFGGGYTPSSTYGSGFYGYYA